jgi:hypothetical protein
MKEAFKNWCWCNCEHHDCNPHPQHTWTFCCEDCDLWNALHVNFDRIVFICYNCNIIKHTKNDSRPRTGDN